MQSGSTVHAATAELPPMFRGQLLHPGEAGYEEARQVHNGLIDKRPALIARCRGVADVVDAVKLAQRSGLEVAVRGGGHNVAGRAAIDGGVMIDLSLMRSVRVDVKSRRAWVEGGAIWADVNRETQLHQLGVTGGVVSTTGVAGLTLGGGLGWLMGKHGLALDNLLSVELVTAGGEVLTASATEHSDLFWALRGGGGNFGIATSFELRLAPVGPDVVGGPIVHPIESAREVLTFYRAATRSLPDEHMIFATLAHAPDGTGLKVAALVTCHCGAHPVADEAVQPLKRFGEPILDAVGTLPYSSMNAMLDANYPKGALNYWKSNFLKDLSDAAIETMIACFEQCPTPMGQLLIEHIHGEAIRIPHDATAFPHRTEGYNFLILAQWKDPAATASCIAWARQTYERMQPFYAAGRYVNYLDNDEAGVAAAYGSNFKRLQQIKAKYDPANFFRMNQNIPPRT